MILSWGLPGQSPLIPSPPPLTSLCGCGETQRCFPAHFLPSAGSTLIHHFPIYLISSCNDYLLIFFSFSWNTAIVISIRNPVDGADPNSDVVVQHWKCHRREARDGRRALCFGVAASISFVTHARRVYQGVTYLPAQMFPSAGKTKHNQKETKAAFKLFLLIHLLISICILFLPLGSFRFAVGCWLFASLWRLLFDPMLSLKRPTPAPTTASITINQVSTWTLTNQSRPLLCLWQRPFISKSMGITERNFVDIKLMNAGRDLLKDRESRNRSVHQSKVNNSLNSTQLFHF